MGLFLIGQHLFNTQTQLLKGDFIYQNDLPVPWKYIKKVLAEI